MVEDISDKCGIIAAYDNDGSDISKILFKGLMGVQHRGQDSFGIMTYDGHSPIKSRRMPGLVLSLLKEDGDILDLLYGHTGIAHVRYATEGKINSDNIQPMRVSLSDDSRYELCFGFNGNVPHYKDRLIEKLLPKYKLKTDSDTEGLAILLLENIEGTEGTHDDIYNANKKLMKIVEGSYSYVSMLHDRDKKTVKTIAGRDTLGIKPACYGRKNNLHAIASESLGLRLMGINEDCIKDVLPGQVIILDEEGPHSLVVAESPDKRHCYFEHTYFASWASKINGISTSKVRRNLGRRLAHMYPVDADIVVGSPESGKHISAGYSEVSGIPEVDAIIKHPYINRTFIESMPKHRELLVNLKFIYDRELIEGKDVVITDDSIVRCTTMKDMVKAIKEIGRAKKVHVRIATPPIISKCDWGIAFRTNGELVANECPEKSLEKYNEFVRQKIDADSMGYMSIEGLTKEIGMDDDMLCLSCLTGIPPYEITTY